jgi:hypothetical protein
LESAISFPIPGFYYSADVWNSGFLGARGDEAGCGTSVGDSAGDICGTAKTADSTVASVRVSVKKGLGASGKYWDGIGFGSTAEVFITANGTSQWNLSFGFDRFQPGIYTLHVRATDSVGETESGSIRIFSVSSDYIVIPIISSMEVLGKGGYPPFRKTPEMLDLKVFDRQDYRIDDEGEFEPMAYANIWERTTDRMRLVPFTSQMLNAQESMLPSANLNCEELPSRDCGVKIQYGNTDGYFYEIMVPSNTRANRAAFGISGSYLVVGKGTICLNGSESADTSADGRCTTSGGSPTPVYVGTNIYSVPAGSLLSEKHLNVTVDGNGKIHSMRSRPIEGTPLVISVPAYLDSSSTSLLVPIVYESIDGNWQAKIDIAPPEGFVAGMSSVQLQGSTGDTDVAQIELTGAGSESFITGLKHVIRYRGQTIDLQMYLEMDGRQKIPRPLSK